jgi:hypothetical protein
MTHTEDVKSSDEVVQDMLKEMSELKLEMLDVTQAQIESAKKSYRGLRFSLTLMKVLATCYTAVVWTLIILAVLGDPVDTISLLYGSFTLIVLCTCLLSTRDSCSKVLLEISDLESESEVIQKFVVLLSEVVEGKDKKDNK